MAETGNWTYSARARRDIKDILEYTDEHWGTPQMVAYAREIHAAIMMLCRYPEAGRRHRVLKPDVRLLTVGSHIIVYRRKGAKLIIVRILHQAMSLRKHV